MVVKWNLEMEDSRRLSHWGTQGCSLILLPLSPLGSDKLVEVPRLCPEIWGLREQLGPRGQ